MKNELKTHTLETENLSLGLEGIKKFLKKYYFELSNAFSNLNQGGILEKTESMFIED